MSERLDHAYLDGRSVVPITFDQYLNRARNDPESFRAVVKQEQIGEFYVSTVFLRLDHGFGSGPLWFETMVFAKPKGGQLMGDEQLQWRYGTYDAAEAGHARAVELAKIGKFDEDQP